MTDIFAQQGINFMSSGMASTHPTAQPAPIETPSVDLNDTAASKTPAEPVDAKQAPAQNSGQAPQATDPQQTSQSLAGAGGEGAGAAGAAPPQPSDNSAGVDIFQDQGITPHVDSFNRVTPDVVQQTNTNALSSGLQVNLNADDTAKPMSRAEMSLPPDQQAAYHEQQRVEIQKTANDMAAMQKQNIDLATKLYGDAQVKQWQANPQGPVDAFLEAAKENRTLPFLKLVNDPIVTNRLQTIAQAYSNNQPISDADKQFAAQYVHDELEQSIRGFTRGGKQAYNISQLPAWMMEFAAADGAAGFAAKGLEGLAGAAGLTEGAAGTVGTVAKMPTTIALMPGQYIPAYKERRLNDSTAITDQGLLVAKQATESPEKAFLMSVGGVAADVASVYAMPSIGKYIVDPATKLLTTPIIAAGKALPVATQEMLFKVWQTVEPAATYSKMLTPQGWANMTEAVGSFQLDKILRTTLEYSGNDKMSFQDALKAMPMDTDELLLAGGLTAIHGSVSSAHTITKTIMQKRGLSPDAAQEATVNMSATEKQGFVNQNLEIPQSPTPSLDDLKASNDNADLPDEHRAGIVSDYQDRLDALNGKQTGPKKPLVQMLKASGGIDPESDVAKELNNLGITPKSAPGLYKKGGTAGELDNIPASEFNARFKVNAPEDGNGYVDRGWLLEQLRNESFGKKLGGAETTDQGFEKMLDEFGINPKKASAEEVYKALGPFPEAKLIAQQMGETLTPQDAVELQHLISGKDVDLHDAVDAYFERKAMIMHADSGIDSASEIVKGGIKEANAANPALIPDKNSSFNESLKSAKLYAEMWNDLAPIENLGKLAKERGADISPAELSASALSIAKSTPALIERQWTTSTTSWDREGNQVVTGKGLKQISDDFDNIMLQYEKDRDTRRQDMSDFRKAMTFIEDKAKGYGKVSDKDYAESQATLSRLTDKYGDKVKWFETFAKEYRDWDNRILHNLVTSGLKTQAWYDDIVGKREWYSSTARVIESEYPEDLADAKGKGIGADVNPRNIGALKERGGSTLEVQDPVLSSMRNSAIIIKRAMLNKVRVDTAKFAEYYPEKVKVKPPAIIREAVDHSYDPKLRAKLEQVVDFLGGEVKRVQQGEKVGDKKNNLGAYQPATKAVWMRAGSTEGTLTHEAGHMLDYVLGLKERLLKDPEMKAELQKLSEDRLRSEITLEKTPEGKTQFAEEFEQNPQRYVNYVKSDREVLANFFDAWVNSPKQAMEKAPKATAAFEKLIDDNPQLHMLKEIAPSTQRATEVIQKELLDYKGPKDSLPFYDKGRLMFLHMDADTAKAFNGLDQVQSTMVGNFIQKIGKAQAKLLQFGATNNPYFIARHFLRGAQSSYINTPEGGGVTGFMRHFAIEIPKGIGAVIGKTDLYREWASNSGALRTFMDTSSEGITKAHDEIFNSGDYGNFLNPIKWAGLTKDILGNTWQTAKQVSDYAPRIAAYSRLKDAGYSDLEAGYLSLEATGNYTRHGSFGKLVNQYSPFFNDRLQGADRFIRAVARDPVGYSLRAAALITMPQLLVTGYYLFAADDETRNEYLNLSDFRRSTAMNIKIAGQWVPIPRAFAPGYVFGALPEFAMIHFAAGAHPELKNFWLHMIGDTINSLSPSTDWTQTIPPFVKAMLESQTNFSFFRQQALFHGDLNNTAPENQSNVRTSETAKLLAKEANKYASSLSQMLHITPVNIDNAVYDMTAHIGVYATQLSDYAINTQKRLTDQPVNEKPTRGSDNPLYGPMMQPKPVGTSSMSFQEFNEHVHDVNQQQNRYKELTGKDQADFAAENHQDLQLHPAIAAAQTQVMHEEHAMRLISENPHLTGDQKAQQIEIHQRNIEIITEGANKMYRNVKGQNQ